MAKRAVSSTAEQLAALPAAMEYISRRERTSRPEGRNDIAGRWHPDPLERRFCCAYVRQPSRAWPLSLLKHCSSVEHVADLLGADEDDVRMFARLIGKAEKEGRLEDVNAWKTLGDVKSSGCDVVAAAQRLGVPTPPYHAPAVAEARMSDVIARAKPRESAAAEARGGL